MAIKTSEFDAFLSINKTNARSRLNKLRGSENLPRQQSTKIDSSFFEKVVAEESPQQNNDSVTQENKEHKRNTNGTQSEHVNVKVASLQSFSTLVGLQRKILFCIYQSSKTTREHISEPLSIEHIAHATNVNQSSVKTSIARLKEKRFIKLSKFKNGRGGWACYEIDSAVYKELLAFEMVHKQNTNGTQTEHIANRDTSIEKEAAPLVITENKFDEVDFDSRWNLDIKPLEHINFNQSHLKQIAQKAKSLSPEEVQECIYAFAYDLESRAIKIKAGGSALNLFMGILTKDQLYSPASPDYINPKVKAAELYLAKKREAKQKYKEMDEELRKDHFINAWFGTLSETEKLSFLPDAIKGQNLPKPAVTAHLRTYHSENIWPVVRDSFYKEKNLPCVETYFFED